MLRLFNILRTKEKISTLSIDKEDALVSRECFNANSRLFVFVFYFVSKFICEHVVNYFQKVGKFAVFDCLVIKERYIFIPQKRKPAG
jgi:hypothetical protein